MSSKRSSTVPAGPKPPTSLASTVVISDSATLIGKHLITIRDNTIVHPRTRLISTHGPITIGSTCIISERSVIGLQSQTLNTQPNWEGTDIGNGVIIEVGATVEARRIGEGCVIEINAKVGKGAVLGKHCKIGSMCSVADNEVLPDYTVIYGHGFRRQDKSDVEDLKMKMVARQVEVLRKLVPSNLAKFQ